MNESVATDRVNRTAVSPSDSAAGATHTHEVDPLTVTKRLQEEGRWFGQIELERDEMMRLAKGRFKTKAERQQWVYSELDRMYPPLEAKSGDVATDGDCESSGNTCTSKQRTMFYQNGSRAYPEGDRQSGSRGDDGQIQGLSELPGDWPELDANASLAVELAWVQANRLRVVTERPGKATLVHLERAITAAPSWAALGWLETSIRSYAKFVDVAAKTTGANDGDEGVMRRERVAIDEVERLLGEMLEAEGQCPTCGRPIAESEI